MTNHLLMSRVQRHKKKDDAKKKKKKKKKKMALRDKAHQRASERAMRNQPKGKLLVERQCVDFRKCTFSHGARQRVGKKKKKKKKKRQKKNATRKAKLQHRQANCDRNVQIHTNNDKNELYCTSFFWMGIVGCRCKNTQRKKQKKKKKKKRKKKKKKKKNQKNANQVPLCV
jgi:hypothetical protein